MCLKTACVYTHAHTFMRCCRKLQSLLLVSCVDVATPEVCNYCGVQMGGQSVEMSGVRSGGQKNGLIHGLFDGYNDGQRTLWRTVRPSKRHIGYIASQFSS